MEKRGPSKAKEPRPSDGSKKQDTRQFLVVESRYMNGQKGKGSDRKTSTPTKTMSNATLKFDVSAVQLAETSKGSTSVRDLKSKSNRMKEKGGDVLSEEAKEDLLFEAYNKYLLSSISKDLVNEAQKRVETDIDKQLAAMQKCVNKYSENLEETNRRADTVCLLNSGIDMINLQTDTINSVEDEPAFMKGKSLTELMNEVEILRNQLPCKGVAVPKTSSDTASFKNAASQLMMSLDSLSAVSGEGEASTSKTLEELQNITKLNDGLNTLEPSIAAAKSKVSACVLEEAASKSLKTTYGASEGNKRNQNRP